MTETNDVNAAMAIGTAIGDGKPADADYAVLPDGYTLHALEGFKDKPRDKRGTATFAHEAAFTDYVKAHKTPTSHLFYDGDKCTMTCVLDYHGANAKDGNEAQLGTGAAQWGRHRAHCALPFDEDWQKWTGINDAPMSQLDFAQFVEDMLPTIAEPDGADLLEMAQTLEASSHGAFRSVTRLSNGAREFGYSEEVTGQAKDSKGGTVEIPDAFTLKLRVFRWGERWPLEAKLRYRIDRGKLLLWVHLHRPQDVVEEAFARVRESVHTETGLKPMNGAPPSAAAIAERRAL